jgi:hypothetical protein
MRCERFDHNPSSEVDLILQTGLYNLSEIVYAYVFRQFIFTLSCLL